MSLQPEYFCSWCHEKQPKETSTLKTCSRCGLVKYCGRECQRADYQDHKYTCREIKKYSKSGIRCEYIPEEYRHPNAGTIEEMERSQYAEEAAHYIIGSICFAYAEKKDSYYAYEKAKEEFEKVLNPPWNDIVIFKCVPMWGMPITRSDSAETLHNDPLMYLVLPLYFRS